MRSYWLRVLNAEDVERCAALEKLLFPGETPWTEKMFLHDLGRPHTFYFGLEDVNGLMGYAGLGRTGPAEAPEYEIYTIGVAPEAQGRGYGRAMMDNICHIADRDDAPIFLEVRVGNGPAIGLYESYGFNYLGIRRNYYQPSGADAHTMVRPRQSEREKA